ncbi:hypothetical protein CF327_g7722 [Tilletia walkeri]|nr:hypothetical protein CF327_g7722 [Tilletia walkeri]
MPALNQSLDHFKNTWNHHPMSTKGLHGMSPSQLWLKSILGARAQGLIFPSTGAVPDADHHSSDSEEDELQATLVVEDFRRFVPESLFDPDLDLSLKPLGTLPFPFPSDDGASHYTNVLEIVADHLDRN